MTGDVIDLKVLRLIGAVEGKDLELAYNIVSDLAITLDCAEKEYE